MYYFISLDIFFNHDLSLINKEYSKNNMTSGVSIK